MSQIKETVLENITTSETTTATDLPPTPRKNEPVEDLRPDSTSELESTPQQLEKSTIWPLLWDFLQTLLLALLLYGGIELISARIRVEGSSMHPTFEDGEVVIVSKLAYKFGEPQRGDVVIFHYPNNPKEEYIKRIIGLPGDRVEIRDGQIRVNGHVLEEPYISEEPNYTYSLTVPAGTLFVLGDNRNNSNDSHNWGPLPMKLVIGKAVFVYWPLSKFGVVEHYTFDLESGS